MDDPNETQRLLDELEPRVERLKSLYQQYFMGIEKIPPATLRKAVDRTFWQLRRQRFRNTRMRFKFQQVLQRYNSYQQYWSRIERQIEQGTYTRHVIKAAKRFGKDEILTAAGRAAQAALRGVEGVPESTRPPVWELPEEATYDGDDEAPTPPSERGRIPSLLMAAVQAYSSTPESAPAASPAGSHPAAGGYGAPPPAQPPGTYPHTPAHGVPYPAQGHPPTPAPHPHTPAHGVPYPPQGYPPAPQPGAPPPQRPVALPPEGAPPRPSPARRPPPPRTGEVPAPQPGPLPLRRPPPPSPGQPPSPPAAPPTATPAAPPNAAAPAPSKKKGRGALFGKRKRKPAEGQGDSGSAAAPAPPRNQNQDNPEARKRQLYDEYLAARKSAGQSTRGLSYDKVAQSLDRQTESLRRRHGKDRSIDYEVATKDGKTIIKPVIK